jgi:hypothetical protein
VLLSVAYHSSSHLQALVPVHCLLHLQECTCSTIQLPVLSPTVYEVAYAMVRNARSKVGCSYCGQTCCSCSRPKLK